jgi:undecaprenyl-diphosphatase
LAFWEILVLAVVQGFTEFLPVSSSGHLVLLQHLLHVAEGDVFLAVLLHCGTLGSVLLVYRREIVRLLRFDALAFRYLVALAVATLPAVVVGLLLEDVVSALFASPRAAGFALLLTAVLLFSTRLAPAPRRDWEGPWLPQPPGLGRALLIGTAQALAITPGISRSGATITAAIWSGLPRAEAARFSFLLSIPAIGGALVLELLRGETSGSGSPGWILALATLVALLVGVIAIRWTARAVVARHFWKFAFYCLILGVAVLLVTAGAAPA